MNQAYPVRKAGMDGWKAGTILLAVFMAAGVIAFALKGFAPAQGVLGVVVLLLLIVGSMFLYFVPTIVAAIRGHHQVAPIVLLNVFLGWTFLGWVGALIWSVSAIRK